MSKERRGSQYVNQSRKQSGTSTVRYYPEYARIDWIHALSLKAKDMVFSNLYHHINVENLKVAFRKLDKHKAYGIDEISKEMYQANLEENINELFTKISKNKWYPKPSKEVFIPKANGEKRAIAIGCTEDKIVQNLVATILEAIYEPIFYDFSYGFRRGKSAHNGVSNLYEAINSNYKNCYVVEIDIEKFFDRVNHKELVKLLKIKIKEVRFITLLIRMLKNSILSEEGKIRTNINGTPQGSPVSPILANIFLHYILDEWFMKNYSNKGKIIRYADDVVFVFKEETEAKEFYQDLNSRLNEFGLNINQRKSKIQKFDYKSPDGTIKFLGFEFYWGNAGQKKYILKLKTAKDKLRRSMQEFKRWIKKNRNRTKLSKLWDIASAKIRGHYNYFGISFNSSKLYYFYKFCIKELYKWLNRRSQKRSFTWEKFCTRLRYEPLPKPPYGFELKRIIGQTWKHTLKSRMRENRKYGSERSLGANPMFT